MYTIHTLSDKLPTLDSTHFTSEKFGEGSGPVLIDYVNCTGSESRLWRSPQRLHIDCLSYTHYYGCSHSGDVGVRCQPGTLIFFGGFLDLN